MQLTPTTLAAASKIVRQLNFESLRDAVISAGFFSDLLSRTDPADYRDGVEQLLAIDHLALGDFLRRLGVSPIAFNQECPRCGQSGPAGPSRCSRCGTQLGPNPISQSI